jgi:hypothetical protein
MPPALPVHKGAANPDTDSDVDGLFQSLPMALLDIEEGLLLPRLEGSPVAVAVEGTRHAHSPKGLGEQPYEGAAIVRFASSADIDPVAILRAIEGKAIQSEEIEGTHVLVFQEKEEDDVWTKYVAFLESHVLIVATDRGYLQEVLARRNATQRVALPNSLREWKFINRSAAYWGIRHYDRTQAQTDPSSPFGGRKAANFPDELATGIGFSVSSSAHRHVVLTYFSGDAGITPEKSPLGILVKSPDAKSIHVQLVKIAPGIIQASCTFESVEGPDDLLFFLMAYLGHAVYV